VFFFFFKDFLTLRGNIYVVTSCNHTTGQSSNSSSVVSGHVVVMQEIFQIRTLAEIAALTES